MKLLLILLLTAAMDLGSPVLPGGEGMEELEEAAHGRRRIVRLASAALPASARAPEPGRGLHVPRPAAPAPTPGGPVPAPRKLPPRSAASALSPDDH